MASLLRFSVTCLDVGSLGAGAGRSHLLSSVRGLRTRPRLQDAAKPAEPIPGIPYKNMTIGVPKEIWQNERRLDGSDLKLVVVDGCVIPFSLV